MPQYLNTGKSTVLKALRESDITRHTELVIIDCTPLITYDAAGLGALLIGIMKLNRDSISVALLKPPTPLSDVLNVLSD
ncbi:MAG: hypothetical protein ACOY5B_10410 [Spirochaetota bacterium]